MEYTQFSPAVVTGTLLLFAVAAVGMLLAPMVIGWFLRPHKPSPEKLAPYECGEPTIGSSNVQFDLRFYVVALLFIVFDVEVAFFFPWAVVFGKANTLANRRLTDDQRAEVSQYLQAGDTTNVVDVETARTFLWIAFFDLLVFFCVLLVAFAYVWNRGDLDWVRSVARQRKMSGRSPPPVAAREPVAVG